MYCARPGHPTTCAGPSNSGSWRARSAACRRACGAPRAVAAISSAVGGRRPGLPGRHRHHHRPPRAGGGPSPSCANAVADAEIRSRAAIVADNVFGSWDAPRGLGPRIPRPRQRDSSTPPRRLEHPTRLLQQASIYWRRRASREEAVVMRTTALLSSTAVACVAALVVPLACTPAPPPPTAAERAAARTRPLRGVDGVRRRGIPTAPATRRATRRRARRRSTHSRRVQRDQDRCLVLRHGHAERDDVDGVVSDRDSCSTRRGS